MWNLLKSELLKLRRCQILWVGLVALALCPLVQYGSQLIVEPEYRNPNYDFPMLFENVVWGNTQIFFPISLVMIGSWLIDREFTHDTLKNIMAIPVSMPKMLVAKLLLAGILAVLLGIYSVGTTLVTGLTVGLSGLTAEVFFHGSAQIVSAALTTYLVCMPLILIFGQIRGAYLGGSILAFFLGYSMMFFKGGILASIYPFSASLILVGFDMSEYAGTTTVPNPLLAVIGVGSMVIWAVLLLLMSSNKKEMKPHKRVKDKGRGKRAVRRKER
jgi:bacitracin transport system permease protein